MMLPENPPDVYAALEGLGYSSVTDLLIARPDLSFWSAAPLLSVNDDPVAPADIESALRAECKQRDDFHFFARAALFTALHSHEGMGWGRQYYLLAGWFLSIVGESEHSRAGFCCDYLQTLGLPDGWKPVSIFDPILEAALNSGFSLPHALEPSQRDA
jgi:hypothetical protein